MRVILKGVYRAMRGRASQGRKASAGRGSWRDLERSGAPPPGSVWGERGDSSGSGAAVVGRLVDKMRKSRSLVGPGRTCVRTDEGSLSPGVEPIRVSAGCSGLRSDGSGGGGQTGRKQD